MKSLPQNIKNWVNVQTTLLVIMMVITAITGFVMLIIRSKLPLVWLDFDKMVSGSAEGILLFFALTSVFYLYSYYNILERKIYIYYFEIVSILISVLFIFPLFLISHNLRLVFSKDIKDYYLTKK